MDILVLVNGGTVFSIRKTISDHRLFVINPTQNNVGICHILVATESDPGPSADFFGSDFELDILRLGSEFPFGKIIAGRRNTSGWEFELGLTFFSD